MDEKKQYAGRRRLMMGFGFAMLAITMAGLLYSAFVIKSFGTLYVAAVVGGLLLFWVFTDIAAPLAGHDFAGRSQAQKNAFYKVAACDLFGYAGLIYFCLALQSQRSYYGAMVYVMTLMMKRRYYEEYNTYPTEEELKEQAETEAAMQEEAGKKAAGESLSIHERAGRVADDEEN